MPDLKDVQCVVCGQGSTRKDWQNNPNPACDHHTPAEVQAAIAKKAAPAATKPAPAPTPIAPPATPPAVAPPVPPANPPQTQAQEPPKTS